VRPRAIARSSVLVLACSACGAAAPAPAKPAPAPSSARAEPAPAARTPRELGTAFAALPSLAPGDHNLVKNASFDTAKSLPWTASFTAPAAGSGGVTAGAYCLEVTNAGAKPWDAQFRHREMTIQKGHAYAIRFKVAATEPTHLAVRVAMSGPPYKGYWSRSIDIGPVPQVVTSDFTMPLDDDPTAEFAFHVGGSAANKATPFSVCVDDVVLEDPQFTPKPDAAPPPVPNVLVNQVGYLPGLTKWAVIKTDATAPLAWKLLGEKGDVLAGGDTIVRGADPSSGDRVHWVDFSAFTKTGKGLVLHVGDDASHPFEVGPAVYRKLKYDALNYFYQSRSGLPIAMPYARAEKWTRPAGHPGDQSVSCAPAPSPDAPRDPSYDPSSDRHCDDTLNVADGWYDAGDHGKYVVNGGIAAWTLLDQYERTKFLGSSVADFGDGKLGIPESHNGVPDLIDEARNELEFMMKMQVPEGHPMAGMVHHKIHDKEWTALGTRPDQDPVARYLHPVSTAATLNVAATAAQGARIWRELDPSFAKTCLDRAERAWAAAVANPTLYAPASDSIGGGPYDDTDVSDEFYWAAAELYVTTKKSAYRDFLASSPHRDGDAIDPAQPSLMTWQHTATLGTISLAVVPNGLPAAEVAARRNGLVKAADAFLAMSAHAGYRTGFEPSPPSFPWGSNSFVLNNALVMALAFDFTHDKKYLAGVVDAMDYVLGRNPNDQSYVTGYGFRPLEHPHHRFWAHQANAAFPEPPPGVLSGGPNSGLQDPYVKALGLEGCAPMKCFADNIEAWSANEEAINWNAPLAWVAAFLDEQSAVQKPRR
ncbi:MAG TPA: glycoside hydrolase family 9 protein, partial [Polyangiaceae bacterium]|nr:glycoside hydrolase family 9 protein [Polyangiaceae bacterium]